MILSDKEIRSALNLKRIIIAPFEAEHLGSNSYDVHLGKILAVYDNSTLDARVENKVTYVEIPKDGYVIYPGKIYLGATLEYTETIDYVPFLEGKSSTGRLGISVHATAGKGDAGFANHWTLEISCIQPVRIYAGMPIAQIIYFVIQGEIETPYTKKKNAKYTAKNHLPQPSAMWKNFLK
ncbi:MAG: dCTP deaminase [Deltaproteobacteria bacterium]|nr:dCTP deaminase [Deltaproteobacteria bacterium]